MAALLNHFTGLDMGVYGLKVHNNVWIARNAEIKGKWMYPHRWTRKIEEAEKFNSEAAAQDYAEKHLLSGCLPALILTVQPPSDGGSPAAAVA